MKKSRFLILTLCVVTALFSILPSSVASAGEKAGEYVYTFVVDVYNPCNSNDMDRDAVNDLYFDFTYVDKNGFGSEQYYRFDMSWSSGSNRNSDFLWKHFIRGNDNGFTTSFNITLSGKLKQMHIKLNMDGGERLGFTVKEIKCNGKRINTNTDYVSSAYSDSDANIYCSMERSVIDPETSEYFYNHDRKLFTEKQMKQIISSSGNYYGSFRDQYNAIIETSAIKNCIESSDGDINQYYSHQDEVSMYKYTLWFNVENPINLNDADYDEVEKFFLRFKYIDKNGYGTEKTYTLDMAYDKGLGRNKNQKYLSYFQTYNDDGFKTHFDVWVPGIVTEVTSTLNMRGERLSAEIERITLNSIAVNTNRDYVASTYYDSDLKITCKVPASQIVAEKSQLKSGSDFVDQYGSMVSALVVGLAKSDPLRYLYHYDGE